MLGFSTIGSQAIADSGNSQMVVIEASGRSSGTSAVFAASSTIVSSSGTAAGKSTVSGSSVMASRAVTAADKLGIMLLDQPYAMVFVQTEPLYNIELI